ncbi:hypothetical protein HPB50_023147 [Hyalomma asiaticum]|uniref:Uncharacterized protein n=1 Tax=Hyalomma asiaticum TaxID=266040 RepID=A0ACB7TMC2_HYAAI|nr:hypothetical protein HPB50_023147 [Hyalomma asiaticum]
MCQSGDSTRGEECNGCQLGRTCGRHLRQKKPRTTLGRRAPVKEESGDDAFERLPSLLAQEKKEGPRLDYSSSRDEGEGRVAPLSCVARPDLATPRGASVRPVSRSRS